jgi:hypothetical protein
MRKCFIPLIMVALIGWNAYAASFFDPLIGKLTTPPPASKIKYDNSTAGYAGDPTTVEGALNAAKAAIDSVSAGAVSDVDIFPGDTVDDDKIDSALINLATSTGLGVAKFSNTQFNVGTDGLVTAKSNVFQPYDAGLTPWGSISSTAPVFTGSSIQSGVAGSQQGSFTMWSDTHAEYGFTLLPGTISESVTFRSPGAMPAGDNYLLNIDASTGQMDYTNPADFAAASHSHTGSTLSGIDISDDTNLSGDTEIVLTGDALSIASSIARDSELPTQSSLSVDDLITLSGVADGAQHLGAFTGATINDNVTIKAALQALETAIEGVETGGLSDLDDLPGDTVDDNKIDAALIADLSSTYTTTGHTHDYVPLTRTVAGHALSSDVTITPADVSLGTSDAPRFARLGLGMAADATKPLVSTGFSVDASGNVTCASVTTTGGDPLNLGTVSNGTPAESDFWYDGTHLYFYNGSASSDLLASITASSTDTLTNKTLDANATGNTVKGYGYITLGTPHSYGSAVTLNTTSSAVPNYGRAIFADDVEDNNWIEWLIVVPPDIDTTVDLTASFGFVLGGEDTGDHDYIISMASIGDSEQSAASLGHAVNLAYTADASGASGDRETATGTLTDWKSNITAGEVWRIRITRDGDDGTDDTSTSDSVSGPLVIRYGFTQ